MTSGCLPKHGRIECAICHEGAPYAFDRTRTTRDGWRITNNPLAWGGSDPEVIVLGFSKGPTQSGDLENTPHDEIAYKSGRSNVAKILHHIGLLPEPKRELVDRLISDPGGNIHFGSLVRCTVERLDHESGAWKGSGGGMLDGFVANDFGSKVVTLCARRFLSVLPERTRLIVMFGMGSKGNYVSACRKVFASVRPGSWSVFNPVTYFDDRIVVVHAEHFASQGALIPNWSSGVDHDRGRFGLWARQGVEFALARSRVG